MTSQPPTPEHDHGYVQQLVREANSLQSPEREEHLGLVSELVGELVVAEEIENQADEAAKVAYYNPYRQSDKLDEEVKHTIDLGKIGWLTEKGETDLPVIKHDGEVPFYIANLIHLDRVADRMFSNLVRSNDAERVTQKLLKDVIPQLLLGIKIGATKERSENTVNTEYTAFKVGVFGTQNRAILLHLGNKGDIPVLGIAAMYDHEDQKSIIRHMYTGKPKS